MPSCRTETADGGVATVGYNVAQRFPDARIGVFVAANAGRPGGACGMRGGYDGGYVAESGRPAERSC